MLGLLLLHASRAPTADAPQLLRSLRAYYSAALSNNRRPLDVVGRNPMLSQPDARASRSEAPFELRVPGVVMAMEPNAAHPGSVDVPNPSAKLLEKVPIAKVTVDGDVTAGSMPEPPGDSQPRN